MSKYAKMKAESIASAPAQSPSVAVASSSTMVAFRADGTFDVGDMMLIRGFAIGGGVTSKTMPGDFSIAKFDQKHVILKPARGKLVTVDVEAFLAEWKVAQQQCDAEDGRGWESFDV